MLGYESMVFGYEPKYEVCLSKRYAFWKSHHVDLLQSTRVVKAKTH